MTGARIHLDSRADHNALMARLCEQAAAGLAHQIAMTNDSKKREAIRRRIQEHELQSEMHRKIVNELQCAD
jgi:hypothetical protein